MNRDKTVHRNDSDYESHGADDARDVVIVAGSIFLLVIGAVSGAILGFIFSGAVRLALATFAALLLGLLLGWQFWGRMR